MSTQLDISFAYLNIIDIVLILIIIIISDLLKNYFVKCGIHKIQ